MNIFTFCAKSLQNSLGRTCPWIVVINLVWWCDVVLAVYEGQGVHDHGGGITPPTNVQFSPRIRKGS